MTTLATHSSPFLALPAELRVMIYKKLLIVGKVFFPEDAYEDLSSSYVADIGKYRKPNLSIFRVCRQIYEEAKKVYLKENLFVIPQWAYPPPFRTIIQRDGGSAGLCRLGYEPRYLKNISISFSPKPRPAYAARKATRNFATSFASRLLAIHKNEERRIQTHWERMIHHLIVCFKLDYLEMDFTNAYCPIGCCRKLVLATWPQRESLNTETFIRGLGRKQGLEGEEQAWLGRNAARFNMSSEEFREKYKIKFASEHEDIWAQWKVPEPESDESSLSFDELDT